VKWSEGIDEISSETIPFVTAEVEPSYPLAREQKTPAGNDKQIIELTRESKQPPPLERKQDTFKEGKFVGELPPTVEESPPTVEESPPIQTNSTSCSDETREAVTNNSANVLVISAANIGT